MLRVVGEYGQRLSLCRADREHGELRIDRARRADHILGEVARVHVGQSRGITERIADARLRSPYPTPVVGVVPVIKAPPPNAGRLEPVVRRDDRVGDQSWEPRRVGGSEAGAQTAHRRGGGMRVRRRDHHAIDRDPAACRSLRLRLVDQRLRHHAGVDDDQRDPHRDPALTTSIVDDDRPYQQRIVDTVCPPFEKPAGDDRGGIRGRVPRRDVDRCSASLKSSSLGYRHTEYGRSQGDKCENLRHVSQAWL